MTQKWNYNHPMLLLSTTTVATKVLGTPEKVQDVVMAGRWVSAVFASLSVVAFTLIAFHFARLRGAIFVGMALSLHHQIFELAHYMKEDTALLCGSSFVILASIYFWKRATLAHAAFLGLACALALSGKYVGIFFVVPAMALFLLRKNDPADSPKTPARLRDAFVGVATFLAVFALCNFPILIDLDGFEKSFQREVSLVVDGQGGTTRSVPHAHYWSIFLDNSNPFLLLGLAAYVVTFIQTRKLRTLPEWVLLILPFAYTLILSFSPKINDRYFLPATVLITYLCVLGLLALGEWLGTYFRKPWITSVVLLILIGFQIATVGRFNGLATYFKAFSRDDNHDHIEYVKATLPGGAVIAQDSRAGLPNIDKPERRSIQPLLPQKVVTEKYAADLGTIKELLATGFTHVAVSESNYGRYFVKSLKPQKGKETEFQKSKQFYEELFSKHKLLWETPRGPVIYLHPGLKLYELQRSGPAAP